MPDGPKPGAQNRQCVSEPRLSYPFDFALGKPDSPLAKMGDGRRSTEEKTFNLEAEKFWAGTARSRIRVVSLFIRLKFCYRQGRLSRGTEIGNLSRKALRLSWFRYSLLMWRKWKKPKKSAWDCAWIASI